VVTEGMKVPPRSVVLGVPGKVVRQVTDAEWQCSALPRL
jgi:carbonic anhydrase/acetyltransferase-like protein (isoleucine patch superfamily)